MLPQSAAVAFVLAKVAVNGAVVECDLVVFAQVDAYLFLYPLPSGSWVKLSGAI